MYIIKFYLWLMYIYQISYIDDCDDVDELMGAEWVCHKEVWQSLWQLAESCVEHNRHKRPSSLTVSTCTVGEGGGMKNSSYAIYMYIHVWEL